VADDEPTNNRPKERALPPSQVMQQATYQWCGRRAPRGPLGHRDVDARLARVRCHPLPEGTWRPLTCAWNFHSRRSGINRGSAWITSVRD